MNRFFAGVRNRLLPILLSQMAGVGCGIVGVRFVSHWVPPAVLGGYGVFLTFTTVGYWLVYTGVIKFIARYWASTENQSGLLCACIKSWARKLLWLLPISGVAAGFIHRLGGPSPLITTGPLFLAAALGSLGIMVQTALQAGRHYWADFAVTIVGSTTRSFVPPLLFLAIAGEAGLYLGFGVHTLCVAAVAMWAVRRHWSFQKNPPAPVAIPSVYDGGFFVILSTATWALSGINRWIVSGVFGETQAGLFTLAGNLAQIGPAILAAVFTQYFQPGLFAAPHINRSDRSAIARRIDAIAAVYTLFALCSTLALRGLAPWLIGPLIAETYRPALGYLVGAGCFSVAVATAHFFHILLLAVKHERACRPVDFSTSILLIAGGVLAAVLGGETWFLRWLLITPIVPWLLTRPVARFHLFKSVTVSRPDQETAHLESTP